MAGYWPFFFFCVFMDRDEVHPAILTEQAWPIKDLLYGIKHQHMINFPSGTKPISRVGNIAPF